MQAKINAFREGKPMSIIEISVLAKDLGIDVDSLRNNYYRALFDELVAKIRDKLGVRYIYTWGNNEKRATLKGGVCKVIARLALNSCLVEFENGQREVISRNALRRRAKS